MDWTNTQGTPMAVALIILVAVAALGGLTFAFSGNVHF